MTLNNLSFCVQNVSHTPHIVVVGACRWPTGAGSPKKSCAIKTHRISPKNLLDKPFRSFQKSPPWSSRVQHKTWSSTFVVTNAEFSICTVHKNQFCENAGLYPVDGWIRLSDYAFISRLSSLPVPTGPNVLAKRADTSIKNSFYYFPEIPCIIQGYVSCVNNKELNI